VAEKKIVVLDFTEQQLFDLDAMVTEGFRTLRDDATEQQRAAALAVVRRIDDNRRALLAGKRPPDAAADRPTRTDLICRIDDAHTELPLRRVGRPPPRTRQPQGVLMKSTKIATLKYRARYAIAELVNRLPGQCWADLVMWVMGRDESKLPWMPSTSCREDMQRTGCCYCGKFQDRVKMAEQDAKAATES
jgi:hypothetical protein